ncbi:hypothetical protein ACWEOW_01900 [Monashia sp. NPDC004114]
MSEDSAPAADPGRPWAFRDQFARDLNRYVGLRLTGYAVSGRYKLQHLALYGALLIAAIVIALSHSENRAFWMLNYFGWCAWYIAIGPVIAWATNVATRAYVNSGKEIDAALVPEVASLVYARWAETWLPARRQCTASFAVALLGPLTLYMAGRVDDGEHIVTSNWLTSVIILLDGYLVAAASYWVISAVALIRNLERSHAFRLLPDFPGHTPGVEQLSRIAGATFVACTAFVLYLLIPFAMWLPTAKSGDSVTSQLILMVIRLITLGMSATVAFVAGYLPQHAISRAIREERAARLLQLQARLQQQKKGATNIDAASLRDQRDRFLSLAQSPSASWVSSSNLQLGIGVVAALVPSLVLFLQ